MGRKRLPRISKICTNCHGAYLTTQSGHRKYCSLKCAYASPDRVRHVVAKDRGTAKCKKCNKTFRVHKNSGKAMFCSHFCAHSHQGALQIKRIRKSAPNGFKCGWHHVGREKCFFRSSWELVYARNLEAQRIAGDILDWAYEPHEFGFDKTSYTPDFRICAKNGQFEYHEVKGYLTNKSANKMLAFVLLFPEITFKIVGFKQIKDLIRRNNLCMKRTFKGAND